MRTQKHSYSALILLCWLLIPATAFGQSPGCPVPGYVSPSCPTPKDPSIPYCAYYDRFPYGLGFHHVPGTVDALNCNFNDYGSLFTDVNRFGCCPETVQRILFQKIEAQLGNDGFNRQWLGGGDVFLLATTALQLGGKGALPAGLHDRVLQAIRGYISTNTPLFPCPADRSNTCMEDYAVAAAAFGWAAAYFHLNGLGMEAESAATRAKEYIDAAFDQTFSLCLHRAGTPCDQCELIFDPAYLHGEILNDRIEVVTFNRGDNPNYGVGLLTLLSAAAEGLDVAQRPHTVTDALHPILAQGLLRHGQKRLSAATGQCQPWGNQCYQFGPSCTLQSCTDIGYRPGMYPVRAFVQERYAIGGGLPLIKSDVYQFNQFCDIDFHSCNLFHGDGRLATYYHLNWLWPFVSRPPLAGRTSISDFNPPMLDVDVPAHMQNITAKTFFFGWAIDRETAIASVTFTLEGTAILPRPISLQGYYYGGARQDVCDFFGLSKCPYCPSGWGGDFDPAPYPNGTYLLRATARSVNGQTATYDRYFVINR